MGKNSDKVLIVTKGLNSIAIFSLNRCRSEHQSDNNKYRAVVEHEVTLRIVIGHYPNAVGLFEQAYKANPAAPCEQMELMLKQEEANLPQGYANLKKVLKEIGGLADALSGYMNMKQKVLQEQELLISKILNRCRSEHQSDNNKYRAVVEHEVTIQIVIRHYPNAVGLFEQAYKANPAAPCEQMELMLKQEEANLPQGYANLKKVLKEIGGLADALIGYITVKQELQMREEVEELKNFLDKNELARAFLQRAYEIDNNDPLEWMEEQLQSPGTQYGDDACKHLVDKLSLRPASKEQIVHIIEKIKASDVHADQKPHDEKSSSVCEKSREPSKKEMYFWRGRVKPERPARDNPTLFLQIRLKAAVGRSLIKHLEAAPDTESSAPYPKP